MSGLLVELEIGRSRSGTWRLETCGSPLLVTSPQFEDLQSHLDTRIFSPVAKIKWSNAVTLRPTKPFGTITATSVVSIHSHFILLLTFLSLAAATVLPDSGICRRGGIFTSSAAIKAQ